MGESSLADGAGCHRRGMFERHCKELVTTLTMSQHFALGNSAVPGRYLLIFILNFVAMLPAATLLDFAGGELARKLPKVFGVLVDTTLGSVVEIILFLVLIIKHDANHNLISVIKAAILGSILTNLLLCLGLCIFAGGIRRKEQTFDDAVSEVGSNLLLVAGMGKLILFSGTDVVMTIGLS